MSFILLVLWVGVCCFSLMLAVFLVKPLFSFKRSREADNSIEVFREDCPELFAVIDDIVRNTGNKMPKHVYLSADVNACVFFNSSFWSIFLPVRKNLKIGLGLFEGLSVNEIKSILAHEFGHFSQKSMRVGSTVYVVHHVLYDMTFTEDFWDRLLDEWCSASYAPWAFMGGVTRKFTGLIKNMNISMYRFVDRSYSKLSRQMEFDADNVSCNYVGSNVFISGMYKTEVNSRQHGLFVETLKSLIDEKKTCRNIFDAYHQIIKELPEGYVIDIEYNKPMAEPQDHMKAKSRVNIEGTWDSHPELEARIANARQNASSILEKDVKEAWTLIPDKVKQMVSDKFLSQVDGREQLEVLSDNAFKEVAKKYLIDHLYKPELKPFFSRRIVAFNVGDIDLINKKVANPFTEENRVVIDNFLVAANDWSILNQVYNGKRDVNRIEYDGKEIPRKGFGRVVRAHKQYYEDLLNQVVSIDRRVYIFLMSEAIDEESRNNIKNAYELLFYADYIITTTLAKLFEERKKINMRLTETAQSSVRTEDDIASLETDVIMYIGNLKDCLKEMDMGAIRLVTNDDYVNKLRSVIDMSYNDNALLDGNFLNTFVIQLPQDVLYVHQLIEDFAKNQINNYAEQYADNPSSEEDAEESYDSTDERLTVADYEVERDDTDHIGPWVLFVFFAAFIFVMFYLRNCVGTEHTESDTPSAVSTEISAEYSNTDSSAYVLDGDAEHNNLEKNGPLLIEGEITDDNMVLIIPQGVFAEKKESGKRTYVYDLCDDKVAPNITMRLISSSYENFDELGFENVWKQAKEQNEDGTVSADYGNLEKSMHGDISIYTRKTIYHGDYDVYWSFCVLCDRSSDKVILLSGWSKMEDDTMLRKIIENVKFKR